MLILIPCPCCEGSGKIMRSTCLFCKGRKDVRLDRYLQTIGHVEELHNVRDFQRRMKRPRRRLLAA